MSRQSSPALKFSGPVLPDGEPRDLYVVDGRVTYDRPAGAESVASGWIVPGLVDAHCHIGLGPDGAVSEEETLLQAQSARDDGALLLRDCGSSADTRWVQEREDLPRLIRAGRHVARTKRYMRNFADEVEPEDLTATVARQARSGDGWVKLVGDWIDRGVGDLAPSFTPEEFASAIEVAHDLGAQVTAHCFGHDVLPGLIEAGIDCIEHGTGLTPDLVEPMARQGTALVPTVLQVDLFPTFAAQGEQRFPRYAATMTDLYARRRETIMSAYEAGVRIFAGTDSVGLPGQRGILHAEVMAMHELGLPAEYALGAASWRGREWLGWNPGLAEGDPADFVVYSGNPLEDLSALEKPEVVVLRGRVVG